MFESNVATWRETQGGTTTRCMWKGRARAAAPIGGNL